MTEEQLNHACCSHINFPVLEARDVLQRLLQPDPKDRISLRDCVAHEWVGGNVSLVESPNMTTSDELNQEVL